MLSLLAGCATTEPQKEDTPELVTLATLTFSATGEAPIVVTATDPDGDGVQDITVDGPIVLAKNKSYVMTIQLINGLVPEGQPGYDITEEVAEEGTEHQFFFSFTDGAFVNPPGNGNLDNGADEVDYSGGPNSKDTNGMNLGITTTWTTGAVNVAGIFRIVLKHQPGTKTSISDSSVGETDLDITFVLSIQ